MSADPPNQKPHSTPTPVTPRRAQPDIFSAATAAQPDQPTLPVPLQSSRSLVGYSVGEFDLIEEIGRGGMGVVYKAKQRVLERFAAVKMLLQEHTSNSAALDRFRVEARASATLEHTNIVRVYGVGDSAWGPYLAMEYIDGDTLENLTIKKDQRQRLPVPTTLGIMVPVVEAVHFAHTRNVVHRDLKPGNIMIDRGKRPVVMDFGIAKMLGQSSGLTQQGVIIGTPAYMSPEQSGEDPNLVDHRSDIYSLGAILYTLLTGRLTFDCKTALQTILKVISNELPPPPSEIRPDIPAPLDELCMKCLAKDPADRFRTAQELAEAMRNLRRKLQPSTSGTSTVVSGLPKLVLVSEDTGVSVRLNNAITLIGRAADCHLIIKKAEVSKHHCRIHLTADEVTVEDLQSANGTSVNDEPIETQVLEDGDTLDVAGNVFHVQLSFPKRVKK